jgi:phosphoribosylformylglycinamidine cyclo-ligase
VLPLLKSYTIKGLAHITGGGLTENIPRILPEGVNAKLHINTWPVHPIFRLIEKQGPVSLAEMYRTFNMGIGMVLVVSACEEEKILEELKAQGEKVFVIGEITAGSGMVEYIC